ncbi:hypothetical protein K458DRAFT_406607 [Lentithecium fluviatile CBS 122367]|uniref:Rhodopsin domain-containing protein n=1 Tax=Lentithecium fluviatile CBS 122367 TaxID=1168545 RepID=A0A6G1ISP2_9PLEO|nr:hypothetical protein K458DRAFT_406607 [Lentithecium fluviatile CBS 122367]
MATDPRAQQTAAVLSIFAIIGTLFVGLRLWTRFFIIRAPGWEDRLLISSWIFAAATAVSIGLQIHFGLGSHSSTLSPYQNEKIAMLIYISIPTYCASLGLTKLAILMQYQRVFTTRRFQIWTWTFIAVIAAYTVATVITGVFLCTPISKFWKPQTEGHCINTFASWFANAIINIITDLMIIILPIPVVRRLKLARKQKTLLIGVFAFGTVVCVISIVRLHSLLVMVRTTDPSYDNAPVASFSVVETWVALICACLPTLRPLLAKWFSGLSGSSANTAGTPSGAGYGLASTTNRKRSAMLPALSSHGMHLGSMRGQERLDRETADDKIKVVTRVDVSISEASMKSPASGNSCGKDERESSTESLFRDGKYGGHMV